MLFWHINGRRANPLSPSKGTVRMYHRYQVNVFVCARSCVLLSMRRDSHGWICNAWVIPITRDVCLPLYSTGAVASGNNTIGCQRFSISTCTSGAKSPSPFTHAPATRSQPTPPFDSLWCRKPLVAAVPFRESCFRLEARLWPA